MCLPQRLFMQGRDRHTVTLVLGGVRSGKSRYAQRLASTAATVAYIATARASDAEMSEKIRRHQEDRPSTWATVEEPLQLGCALNRAAQQFDCVLVDCLTVFTANLLETAETEPGIVDEQIGSLLEALQATAASIILVSNEVGSGVVPPYPLGRRYRDLLGELNQQVAAIANNVLLMVAGLPLVLRGSAGAQT